MLNLGVVGTSRKENEKRVPIHPRHISRIEDRHLQQLTFETGYGQRFGFEDEFFVRAGCTVLDRQDLLQTCDAVILPKPIEADLEAMRDGLIVWGWPHCVQQRQLTEIAIKKRLTLIAFEAMFDWSPQGHRGIHTFYRNNELAGYCAVLHALELMGKDGFYGPQHEIAILSFGSVSRGAAYALQQRGFGNITIYTQRPPHAVGNKLINAQFGQMYCQSQDEASLFTACPGEGPRPMKETLADADLIVNGILQDTDSPVMFLSEKDASCLREQSLIIDVSCDRGMGFPFARPTTFASPTFRVGHATYYAVDHTPTYLWDAASWEISEAVLPFLATVMNGKSSWRQDATISRAIEIEEGVIQNEKILSFQKREPAFPHATKSA
ncbi:MAG: N(5)-(carboxyethyl)ornithine synthase [Phycisphaerae bacterium]